MCVYICGVCACVCRSLWAPGAPSGQKLRGVSAEAALAPRGRDLWAMTCGPVQVPWFGMARGDWVAQTVTAPSTLWRPFAEPVERSGSCVPRGGSVCQLACWPPRAGPAALRGRSAATFPGSSEPPDGVTPEPRAHVSEAPALSWPPNLGRPPTQVPRLRGT